MFPDPDVLRWKGAESEIGRTAIAVIGKHDDKDHDKLKRIYSHLDGTSRVEQEKMATLARMQN